MYLSSYIRLYWISSGTFGSNYSRTGWLIQSHIQNRGEQDKVWDNMPFKESSPQEEENSTHDWWGGGYGLDCYEVSWAIGLCKQNQSRLCKQNWNIRSVSEVALFCHEAGRHFIMNFRIYCSNYHDEAGIFKCFVLFGNCE